MGKAIAGLINKNTTCTVTPLGEVLDIDLHLVPPAQGGTDADISNEFLQQSVIGALSETFVKLASKPVSAGEIYEGGDFNQNIQFGHLTSSVSYGVLSVSGDKRKVVLKPIIRFNKAPGDLSEQADSIVVDGWTLFDRDHGKMERSFIKIKMVESKILKHNKATMETVVSSKVIRNK
jgi:hypothetical protein